MTTEPRPTHDTDLAVVDTTKPNTTDPDTDGFAPIIVKVGPGGGRTQRFTGRQVGESRQVTRKAIDTVRVYLTRKGNYLVHKQTSAWSDYNELGDWTEDWKNWRSILGKGEQSWGDYTTEVVDSLDALRPLVSPKVHLMIVDRAQHPLNHDLDV
ncbi:EXLDI protein [Nocardia salmonicida]|uniref:EXLDI protein n=1 Tax=Nocardia salmonicida TaxID=53431 RepID=UPI0007A55130|nr:EXLDI protein [Nocardia salmonicida]